MKVKYNRTSTINQDGERFKLDKTEYDLTLFDKGVSGMGNLQSHINGKKNPIWNLITSVMSSLYEMERENILERTEMGRKMYVLNGGKLGRKVGSNENIQSFLNKPKNQQIISLLDKGKSVRDICGRLDVSTKTVVKVRKHYEPKPILI